MWSQWPSWLWWSEWPMTIPRWSWWLRWSISMVSQHDLSSKSRRRPRVCNSRYSGAAGAVKSSDTMPRGVSVFVFVCARDGLLWCATHIVGMELNRNYDPTHDSIGKIQKQESSSAFKDPFAFAPFSSAVWWTTRWRNDSFIDSFNCVVPYFVKLIIHQCGHRLSGGQKDTGAAIEQMFNNSENFLGGKDKIK